jgi:hypothetical protein
LYEYTNLNTIKTSPSKEPLTFTLGASTRKEIGAQSAAHDLVKLLDSELVSIDLLDLALSLTNSSSTAKTRGVSLDANSVLD